MAALILALSGWTAFTLLERLQRGKDQETATAQPEPDRRVEGFIVQARKHLDSGELDDAQEHFQKASGLADNDVRVLEGLALVEVMRAERTWWELMFGKHDHERRTKLLKKLDGEVERARAAVERSLEKSKDPGIHSRLDLAADRLNAMQVVALGLHGDVDRARTALKQLSGHPQKKLIREFVETVGQSRPQEEEDAGAEIKAPVAKAPGAKPAPGTPHYELDHEPKHLPKTPDELEIPQPAPDPE